MLTDKLESLDKRIRQCNQVDRWRVVTFGARLDGKNGITGEQFFDDKESAEKNAESYRQRGQTAQVWRWRGYDNAGLSIEAEIRAERLRVERAIYSTIVSINNARGKGRVFEVTITGGAGYLVTGFYAVQKQYGEQKYKFTIRKNRVFARGTSRKVTSAE